MELVVLALAAAAAAADPLVVRVNKCCPPHQQLAINMTACLDYKYDVPRAARPAPAPPPLPWWVSGELRVVAPSGQEVGAAEATWLALPGAPPGCPAARRSLLMQHLDQFTVAHDGRLLLYDGDEEPPLQLPPSAFCLDRMEVRQGGEGRLVALACECSAAGTWCWRRCCPAGFRLAVAEQDRVHEDADCARDTGPATGPQARGPRLPAPPGARPRELYGFPQCEEGEHVSATHAAQQWRLLGNGSAVVGGVARAFSLERYCADAGRGLLLYCSGRPTAWQPSWQRGLLYGLLFAAGAAFLLATILVYSCLPGLLARTHARAVVCHAGALLAAYVALAAVQTWPDMPPPACCATAFIVQYSFLAAFFWLNVMCLDISWAFSGLRALQGGAWDSGRRRFWWFSAYAWGGAGVVCAATAAAEFSQALPRGATLKPDFGAVRCWFRGRVATLVYFYGPVALLLLGNLSLFTYTAVKIVSAHRETQILNMVDGHRWGKSSGRSIYRKERQRLALYTKLFGLMGLTWVMEVVSWAVGGPAYYWYLTDLVNLLRAVFLFYLLCCKRSVARLLRARLCCGCAPPHAHADASAASGSGSSNKSKTEVRSRSLTSQRTTSFKLTDLQVLQLSEHQPPTQQLPPPQELTQHEHQPPAQQQLTQHEHQPPAEQQLTQHEHQPPTQQLPPQKELTQHEHQPPAQQQLTQHEHQPPAQQQLTQNEHQLPTQQQLTQHEHQLLAQQELTQHEHQLLAQQQLTQHEHQPPAQQQLTQHEHQPPTQQLPPQKELTQHEHQPPAQQQLTQHEHQLPTQQQLTQHEHQPPAQQQLTQHEHQSLTQQLPPQQELTQHEHQLLAQQELTQHEHQLPAQQQLTQHEQQPPAQQQLTQYEHQPPTQQQLTQHEHQPPAQQQLTQHKHQPPAQQQLAQHEHQPLAQQQLTQHKHQPPAQQ